MRDKFHPDMSAEMMAAWLDGNLSAEDMKQMADQIQDDPMLEELVAMSDEIDSDIEAFEASGEGLPEELQNDNFNIPDPDFCAKRRFGSIYGMVSNAMPAQYAEYDCCEAAPAAFASSDEDESEEDKSLLDKLKDLFSNNED